MGIYSGFYQLPVQWSRARQERQAVRPYWFDICVRCLFKKWDKEPLEKPYTSRRVERPVATLDCTLSVAYEPKNAWTSLRLRHHPPITATITAASLIAFDHLQPTLTSIPATASAEHLQARTSLVFITHGTHSICFMIYVNRLRLCMFVSGD